MQKGLKCSRCGLMQTSHEEPCPGAFLCLHDGQPAGSFGPPAKSMRQTTSFSPDEVVLLKDIVQGMMSGRDMTILVRHPLFRNLAKKLLDMHGRLLKKQRGNPDD